MMSVAESSSPDPRAARSRAAMRAGMVSLLGEQPLDAITAAAVAQRAGVGYATFFRHYADPAALLADVADAMIADLLAAMLPLVMAGDRLGAMRVLAAYVGERREVAKALLVSAGPETQRLVARAAIARSLSLPHLLDTDLAPDLAMSAMVASAFATLAWWLEHAPTMPPDALAALLLRIAVAPIVSQRP